MPKIEVSEEQILKSLDQLSAAGRREALRRLLPLAAYLDRQIERNRPRIESLARQRGLDFNSLTEVKQQTFIDELLHE